MDALLSFFCSFACRCPSARLVLTPFLNWHAHFSGPCPTILYPAFLPHMRPRFPSFFSSPDRKGFERQRGNPAWGLFWYCWTFSWKTFLLGDQQCSGFRAVGSSCLNTSSDHNSKNVSDELQTCSVFSLLGPETLWSDSQHLNLRVPIPLLSLMYVGFRTPCHLPAYSGALCSSSVKKWFLKVQNINTATITYFLPRFCRWLWGLGGSSAFTDFLCSAVWAGVWIGVRLNKLN